MILTHYVRLVGLRIVVNEKVVELARSKPGPSWGISNNGYTRVLRSAVFSAPARPRTCSRVFLAGTGRT